MLYCIVPSALAGSLHEPLREHFGASREVEVVVEGRRRERRRSADRRALEQAHGVGGRRVVRAAAGRRVADRRSAVVHVEAPALPVWARPHARELRFVERAEPRALAVEDVDTARLVVRLQAGEEDLFDVLYMRYFDRVYGHLRAFLGDRHEAEDVAQEVFVRVFQALPRYEHRGQPFRAWLFRIAHNCAVSRLRKTQRTIAMAPGELIAGIDARGAAEDEQLDWLAARGITQLLERLPPAQRQALVLGGLIGLSGREIAVVLGRSPANVRLLQHRGARTIRERLSA